jgi:hypothetical protein
MNVYVVRAENSGEPENYVLGAFDTKLQALVMVDKYAIPEDISHHALDTLMDNTEHELFEYVWVEELEMNKEVCRCNR